jgi:Domain of unknown function (DUF4157)
MAVNSATTGGANNALNANSILTSRLTGFDPTSIANGLLSRVQSGENLGQMVGELKGQLSPVDQGNVLRELDQGSATGLLAQMSPRFPYSGSPDLGKGLRDLLGGAVDLGKQSLGWLKDRAGEIKDKLVSLPNSAANALADSMRGPSARTLTSGEQTELRKVFGNSIDLSNVRIVNGAGYNPDAKIAFDIGGNPAITEGNTVYIKSDGYMADFSKDPEGIRTLAHEFTHVYQFQKMGFGSFFGKYAKDLVNIGDRNKIYDYNSRPNTTYKTETLEGQAQMVGDYARYKAGDTSFSAQRIQNIENRLKGTGLFGL